MKKNISVGTVAKRMNRVLETYKEQQRDNPTPPEQSTSTSLSTSTFGQMVYSTAKGLDLHKNLLNFIAQDDSTSESDSSDQSYALIESPPKRRRQPQRAVKRPVMKISTIIAAQKKQRKLTSMPATASPATTLSTGEISESDVDMNDTDSAKSIKGIASFNENDNRQAAN